MKKFSILLIAALAIVACTKKFQDIPQAQKLIHKTFTVSAPVNPDGIDTASKTELAADGLTVNWSAGDEINVIGVTADGTATQHPFSIKSGVGTPNATFEGEVGENEVTFYAVYPNAPIVLSGDKNGRDLSNGKLAFSSAFGKTQTAVKGGFDKDFSVMTAIADANSNFAFRHGTAFFRLKIAMDHVNKVVLKSSNDRFNGRPIYIAETGDFSSVESAQDNITLAAAEGSALEKGATYYIPVLSKLIPLRNFTITFSFDDGTSDKSLTTTKMTDLSLAYGKVYNLGSPSIVIKPEISADNVNLDATATSGNITYSIVNPVDGGVLTAALKEATDWLTIGSISNGAVALTATANTGVARSTIITLTYTYNGTETVMKDVTVNQGAASSVSENHTYTFYVSAKTDGTSRSNKQTKDGEVITDNLYFTIGGNNTNFQSNYSNKFFTIDGTDYYAGLKMDSNGTITFTTSATLKTTLRFYAAAKSSSETSLTVKENNSDFTSVTVNYGTANTPGSYTDSQVINLGQGKTYQIAKKKSESSVIQVVVTESN